MNHPQKVDLDTDKIFLAAFLFVLVCIVAVASFMFFAPCKNLGWVSSKDLPARCVMVDIHK